MIWGGARAKAGKRTQRLLTQEKNSIQQQVGQEKNSTVGWPGKKLNANSLPEAPPQIINGPSLTTPV